MCVFQVTLSIDPKLIYKKKTEKETAALLIRITSQELLPFLLRGNNRSISGRAKTYVINVCSAACSICASVFLASPYSLCQHGTAEGPSWSGVNRERGAQEGKTMHGSASTRASAPTCEPLTCILAVKNVFCFPLLQLSLFLRVMGKQIRLVSLP